MKMKIAIIDKLAYNQSLIQSALNNEHHEVVGRYPNIFDALAFLKKTPPDLVFIDFIILQEEGFENLKDLIRINKNIKFVLLTIDKKTAQTKSLQDWFLAVLLKPLEEYMIIDTLKSAEAQFEKQAADYAAIPSEALPQKQIVSNAAKNVDIRLIRPVVLSIKEVIGPMITEKIYAGRPASLEAAFTTQGVAGCINCCGDFEGDIILDMNKDVACYFTGMIVHQDDVIYGDFVESTIGEITNMIAGHVASKVIAFGELSFSTPRIITQNIFDVSERRNIIVQPIGIGSHIINVNFFLNMNITETE